MKPMHLLIGLLGIIAQDLDPDGGKPPRATDPTPPRPTPAPPPLVWYAPFLSGGGYSSEALSFILQLSQDLPPHAIAARQFADQPDTAFIQGLSRETQQSLQRVMYQHIDTSKAVVVCHSTPDIWVPSAFPGWDELMPCPPPGAGHSIGRTMYETDSVPDDWVTRLNKLDEVWVPTSFHKRTFAGAGVHEDRIVVIPEAVDTAEEFNPSTVKALKLPNGISSTMYKFLSVFKWEPRKAGEVLLRAFMSEFSHDDDVVLIIKTKPFYSDPEMVHDAIQKAIEETDRTAEDAPHVHVIDRELPSKQLPRLYASADAFVLPSRGEGWGRPHAEAMAMALPLIATNFSGPTAFMTDHNSLPVRVDRLVDVSGMPGHRWAEPDLAHLRERMRWAYENREEARIVGQTGREHMARHFSPSAVAAVVIERLEQIAEIRPDLVQRNLSDGLGAHDHDEL